MNQNPYIQKQTNEASKELSRDATPEHSPIMRNAKNYPFVKTYEQASPENKKFETIGNESMSRLTFD